MPDVDPLAALAIARTKERIALLKNLIATQETKGLDVSKHKAMLADEERYLANGCLPRGYTPEPHQPPTQGVAVPYIMPSTGQK